jgi:pyruvate,water dikinase
VGGKGFQLLRMCSVRGVEVPPGFALTTHFFEPWFAKLSSSLEWAEMMLAAAASDGSPASGELLRSRCGACQKQCESLTLSESGRQALMTSLTKLPVQRQIRLAVRSSSPEEDMAGLSFAGGYETLLGVPAAIDPLQVALRAVFASCLDARVFAYKRAHGMADLQVRTIPSSSLCLPSTKRSSRLCSHASPS